MTTQCFYIPSTRTIIDTCVNGLSHYNKKTKEQFELEYGQKVEVWSLDEAYEHHENSFLTEPKEITEERFFEALECLPPLKWKTDKETHSMSFMMSEMTSGRVTEIYVRKGSKYYSFGGFVSMTHSDIMDKVQRFINSNR